MLIRKGTGQDVGELAALYDVLNDYLESHVNYPGWKKGVYPTREDAVRGVEEGTLFVAVEKGRIASSFLLRHKPEEGYAAVDWQVDLPYSRIFVLYTLAVHPDFLGRGTGREMVRFSLEYAADAGMQAVRLDVYEKSIPAIRLYESLGFSHVGTVDLGYGAYGLEQFRLYQKLL